MFPNVRNMASSSNTSDNYSWSFCRRPDRPPALSFDRSASMASSRIVAMRRLYAGRDPRDVSEKKRHCTCESLLFRICAPVAVPGAVPMPAFTVDVNAMDGMVGILVILILHMRMHMHFSLPRLLYMSLLTTK